MSDIKDQWKFRDRLINGITEDGHFRISVVKATSMVTTAMDKHHLNPLGALTLGRLLIGATLATTSLKGEERISMKIEGNGAAGVLVCEANALGEIRGFMSNPSFKPQSTDQQAMLKEAIGTGFFHYSKVLYGQETPYVSSTPLATSDIISDISYFYLQSEQLPTAIKIDIDFNDDFSIRQAHGLIIQALPDATDEERDSISQLLSSFPTLTELADSGLYVDEIMNKVKFKTPIKEMSRRAVDFYCSCSKDRFADALNNIEKVEIIEMSHTEQTMVCHYCNSSYVFSSEDLQEIASKKE
jgi:molecular chaperone Hsp33